MEKYTNALVNESSPYLLQHAHNPVNWVPWADDVFERAEKEGKLVLISVGYSACHWCHVMEHESFEDEEVAALMNKFFINVKVDREERPDVDQVYMTAVQLMTQKGGWPLNCFTLPDGRPIYGGTYFPKEQWMHILKSLQHTFTNELPKVQEYAKNLHEGIIASELIDIPSEKLDFEEEKLTELMQRWSKMFDWNDGGNSRAPKFPLPSNLNFLLDYGINAKNNKAIDHVELTLDKMALGGIYDQIGGGFSRYSVDMLWKVPHFEKMLYDNGQLLSTYSKGYRQFKKPLYKRLVSQTIDWLEREMLDESGAFFSALDADSEGVEGKFYVWKKEELDAVLSKDDTWVYDFYQVNQRGYWEEDNYILLRSESDEVFAKKFGWTIEELELKIKGVNQQLLDERSSRVRPGLDNKCITSWNAMTLKGLCDAYAVFGEESYLFLALKNARWLTDNRIKEDGAVIRLEKNEQEEIEGFLEDYAHAINAFMTLYQVTLDESWLNVAKKICDYTVTHFQDAQSKMFYFTPTSTQLIARKMEINDNVI
ncbi:MAG: thioredoxin domain-containing protein, partial [Crocinitomicaceae bacterium]|nr:thioredoxin domain-containing protein [Crocinitomicaceae bacterium]